jgi:hypothetical protein
LRVFFLLDVHVLGVDIGGGKEDNVMLSKLPDKPVGRIIKIVDHGTIIRVHLWCEEQNHLEVINFDHSPFRWFAEAQGYDFTGKTYRYDPENFTLTDVSEED